VRTRDPHLALDLVSETFLAAFAHREQCRARSEGGAAAVDPGAGPIAGPAGGAATIER
jgi:hypothetical protein